MFGTYLRLNLHVSASWRDVVRKARTKLNRKARTSRAYREARHEFYRQMLQYHENDKRFVREWRLYH